MMTILNYISFIMIFASLGFAVAHPRIKFPIHVELFMILIAIGSAAMLINAYKGGDMYGYKDFAEIILRLGLGGVIAKFIHIYLKEHSG